MKNSEIEPLKRAIIKAFSDAIYPGDDGIVDDSGRHLEKEQIKRFFKGKQWADISLHNLRNEYEGDESACLFFILGKTVQYYLPAYMLISLDQYDDADMIVDSVINVLTPISPSGEELEQFAMWAGSFSSEQRNVISRYLHYMKEYHADDFFEDEPDIALERFWKKYHCRPIKD